jgi:hypothetical protein
MKYRKKPVVVEAFQMTRDLALRYGRWPDWLYQAWIKGRDEPGSLFPKDDGEGYSIQTLEGVHDVTWGDFIIQGVRGELYPCKPDIFAETYEEVDDE